MLNANPEKQGLLKQKTRLLAGLPIRRATLEYISPTAHQNFSDYGKQLLTNCDF